MDLFGLIIPAFLSGILTFLAPCTLPLVPGYLGFISGVSSRELHAGVHERKHVRAKIFWNGILYVLGFSVVFVFMGTLFGLGGLAFLQYRIWLMRIGGIFVIFFGLFLLHVFRLPFFDRLNVEHRLPFAGHIRPGRPASSFLFGGSFALGWTPCIGPILGSVLLLASSTATVFQGAFLLAVFSFGLAVPFLLIALGVGTFSEHFVANIQKYLNPISMAGGVFLVVIGVLLFTDNFTIWVEYFYRAFGFLQYPRLFEYL
jgi:cytochrome c-type biogenesis protein